MPHGRFPFQKLAKYPHLKPEDIKTWERFIDSHPHHYDTVDYDVGLSRVEEAAAKAAELDIKGDERLYQYKVDVCGYGPGITHIIELKGKATPQAIGQVLAYKMLYDRDLAPAGNTRAVIIAMGASPEMQMLCTEQNILLILV